MDTDPTGGRNDPLRPAPSRGDVRLTLGHNRGQPRPAPPAGDRSTMLPTMATFIQLRRLMPLCLGTGDWLISMVRYTGTYTTISQMVLVLGACRIDLVMGQKASGNREQ